MGLKVTIPKKMPSFERMGNRILDHARTAMSVNVRQQLVDYVAPFSQSIPIEMYEEERSESISFEVTPRDGATYINVAGTPVSAQTLLMWLSQGTDDMYVVLPADFRQQTSPRSMTTSPANYNRNLLYINTEQNSSIYPRNIEETFWAFYSSYIERRINAAINLELGK